jgi:hypothetical protein
MRCLAKSPATGTSHLSASATGAPLAVPQAHLDDATHHPPRQRSVCPDSARWAGDRSSGAGSAAIPLPKGAPTGQSVRAPRKGTVASRKRAEAVRSSRSEKGGWDEVHPLDCGRSDGCGGCDAGRWCRRRCALDRCHHRRHRDGCPRADSTPPRTSSVSSSGHHEGGAIPAVRCGCFDRAAHQVLACECTLLGWVGARTGTGAERSEQDEGQDPLRSFGGVAFPSPPRPRDLQHPRHRRTVRPQPPGPAPDLRCGEEIRYFPLPGTMR